MNATLRSVLAAVRGTRADVDAPSIEEADEVPRKLFLGGLAVIVVAATIAQVAFFGIIWWTAIRGVI